VSNKLGVWNAQNLPSGRVTGQSKALREAIKAPDGHVLIGADSSQIECRVIDYMAGDTMALQDFVNGVCPYSSLAVSLFNEGTPEQVKRDAKKGIEPWAGRRQISKSARLSLQFGSGANGFMNYCAVNGAKITLEEAEFYKSGFRRSKPALVNLWKQCGVVLERLHVGMTGSFGGVTGDLFYFDGTRKVLGQHIPAVRLPDGCWLNLPQLQQIEGNYGPTFMFIEMQGRKKEFVYMHGAKLAQQLTQATAFAAMKWYAGQIDYPIVLNSHDEHVVSVPIAHKESAVAHLTQVMSTSPPWAPTLPLACEVHVGGSYGELK
jgi:DNA polymerase